MLLNIPVSYTSPKAGSFGVNGAAKSVEAARIEEKVETEEPAKTGESKGGEYGYQDRQDRKTG